MIKALAKANDGRLLLVIGLSENNIAAMRKGNPVYFDMGQLSLHPRDKLGHVTIFYGPTEEALGKALQPLIGKNTVVKDIPKSSDTPQ